MSETKDIKTKSELMDSFVQIAIARGFSDYDGEAERFINETVDMYSNLPQPQLTIPKSVADELEKYDFELTSKGLMYRNMGGTLVEFSRVTYDEIPQLIVQTIDGNYRIVFAYLNPLTRDLVKVVEG